MPKAKCQRRIRDAYHPGTYHPPPRCPEDQDSSEKEKEIPPSAAPQASPLHAVSCEGHAVPKRRCKIQNNHREVAALTAPSPMLFHFFRTSFADATGPLDSNVAAGPSSIRMHRVEHVSQRITRFAPVDKNALSRTIVSLVTRERLRSLRIGLRGLAADCPTDFGRSERTC
jgi:hypothetical protein